jgi:D-lactate dehydrogenase (cytochrome)
MNGFRPSAFANLDGNKIMGVHLFKTDVEGQYPDYLRDESRRRGRADLISFAASEEDIRKVLLSKHAITTQGARTGVTGGAVPDGGHVLNLSRMKRITGMRIDPGRNEVFISVQPGLALVELRKILQTCEFDSTNWSPESLLALDQFRQTPAYFFPPDPTETSASIGGMVACNASGACSFRYGATRAYVEAMRVMLADGSVISLRRGRERATGGAFTLLTEEGREISGRLPDYIMPAVKNAAGFFVSGNMELIDLFIGSEGTLGIISEIELRLIRTPDCRWGVMAFFPSEASAVKFVENLRTLPSGEQPAAIEYFDTHALDLLRRQKREHPGVLDIPALPSEYHSAIYLEYHGGVDQVSAAVAELPARMESAGGNSEASWIADSDRELERFKVFRHAVPELVNRIIDDRRKKEPELTKLGTDMAVLNSELSAVMDLYRNELESIGLDYVIFGHIGNNHLHVNILPRTLMEYQRGKDLYLQWARQVIQWGGTVSAEHGIGKFKVALLREMLGDQVLRQMREMKKVFDPDAILNKGNLFS